MIVSLFLCFATLAAILVDFFNSRKPVWTVGAIVISSSFLYVNSVAMGVFVGSIAMVSLFWIFYLVNAFRDMIFPFLLFATYYLLILVFQSSHLSLNQMIPQIMGWFAVLAILSIGLSAKDLIAKSSRLLFYFMVLWAFFEYESSSIRTVGPVATSTGYGVLLSVLWALDTLYSYLKKTHRIYFAIQFPLYFFALSTTGTRMGLIAVVVVIVYAILLSPNGREKFFQWSFRVLRVSIVLGVLLACLWFVLPDHFSIKQRVLEGMGQQGLDESNLGRLMAWDTALKAFGVNPLFGIGQGNFEKFMMNFYPEFALFHAHSIYFFFLSEFGLVGLSFLLLFVFWSVMSLRKASLKIKEESHAVLLSLLVFLILGFFDTVGFYASTQFMSGWLLILILTTIKDFRAENTSLLNSKT
jgi:O-antigen ligase